MTEEIKGRLGLEYTCLQLADIELLLNYKIKKAKEDTERELRIKFYMIKKEAPNHLGIIISQNKKIN